MPWLAIISDFAQESDRFGLHMPIRTSDKTNCHTYDQINTCEDDLAGLSRLRAGGGRSLVITGAVGAQQTSRFGDPKVNDFQSSSRRTL